MLTLYLQLAFVNFGGDVALDDIVIYHGSCNGSSPTYDILSNFTDESRKTTPDRQYVNVTSRCSSSFSFVVMIIVTLFHLIVI